MMKLDFRSSSGDGRRGCSGVLATALAAVSLGALGASAPGCQDIDEPVKEATPGRDSYKDPGQCQPWECGSNHELLNGKIIGEIDLDHTEGNGGFAFVSFLDVSPLSVDLDVEDGELVGIGPLGGRRYGADLEGGLIVLEDLDDLSLHVLIIEEFGYVDSWTDPVHDVPAYHFLSATFDGVNPGTTSETCGSGTSIWVPFLDLAFHEHYAVVVANERYDPDAITVSDSSASADRWVNFACAGHALAKMKLLGYDPEYTDTSTTFASTPAERQATLKMITADYCGTGVPFTVAGQPLIAENADGTALLTDTGLTTDESESIWTEDGALCLDTARRAAAESGIEDDIADECEAAEHDLPACDEFLPDWESEGLWRTWTAQEEE